MKILENEILKPYTSFKTGGPADLLLIPDNTGEFAGALLKYPDAVVLGNASNTLVTDKGIKGTVIFTTSLNGIDIEGEKVSAQCGVSLSSLAMAAQKHGLSGFECLYGIPGTVGGGIYMNAGAYGGEIADFLMNVTVIDKSGKIEIFNKDELGFGYRKSIFQNNEKTILSADFMLHKDNKEEIKDRMNGYMKQRRMKQPLEYPSCGSTFKRPEGHYAGKLIEECGLKGFSIGGAAVSEKHAGFIINKKNASSGDIIGLIEYIKRKVNNDKNIMLEEEIKIIGEE